MADVKLKFSSGDGKKSWNQTLEQSHAEKVLRKSKNVSVAQGEKFEFKDNSLIPKGRKSE